MGRKQYDYWLTEEGLTLVSGWARNGLTDEQIAKNIGVSRKTYYAWMKKYPEFRSAVRKNKEMADLAVENALYRSAMGYTIEEDVMERVWDPKEKEYKVQPTKKRTRYVPPSQTAQIFWLKNRRPDLWRDKQEIEHTAEGGTILITERREKPEYERDLEAPAETG